MRRITRHRFRGMIAPRYRITVLAVRCPRLAAGFGIAAGQANGQVAGAEGVPPAAVVSTTFSLASLDGRHFPAAVAR
ncbi:hypothetical protein MJ561_27680 [Klebsiella pneumoniae]|nr:hypothetical protein MJ561_27680 [Klebsiella pneumoniae]